MAFKIIYTDAYNKKAAKFLKRHPDLTGQYEKTLKLLEINPFHPSLRLHGLKGRLKSLSSVSINISYRITLELIITEKEIIPIDVGHHHQKHQPHPQGKQLGDHGSPDKCGHSQHDGDNHRERNGFRKHAPL